MNDEYIKQLEETIENLKRRLESELLGKEIIVKVLEDNVVDDIHHKSIERGQIVVGYIVFAKIVKRDDGWCGYVLNGDGSEGYKYMKFAMKCETFEDVCKKCLKSLALDEPCAVKIYANTGTIVTIGE